MPKYSFDDIIEKEGRLVYSSVGTSMLPLIHQGKDLVVIERHSGRLKKYDIPLYKRSGGQYVLHRVVKVLPEGYLICGDNLHTKEKVADCQIIGILTAIIRNGREKSIESPGYKVYSRVWVTLGPVRSAAFRARGAAGRIKRRLFKGSGGKTKRRKTKDQS